MKRVKLQDATLSTVDVGSGPTLLLVHGFPLDHSMWMNQIESLSADFRIIAPDLRGFGASTGVLERITMEQMSDDLSDLLDELEVTEPITFCGLSMGGYVGWQFWQRHRGRLARLIMCDTRAISDSEEVARGRRIMAERVLQEGTSIIADTMIPKLFAEKAVQERADFVVATRQVMEANSPATVAGALRGMAERPDVTDSLPKIDVPTLVICGEQDQISTVEEMRSISLAIPKATFVEIAGSGHMTPLEDPVAVNKAIREF